MLHTFSWLNGMLQKGVQVTHTLHALGIFTTDMDIFIHKNDCKGYILIVLFTTCLVGGFNNFKFDVTDILRLHPPPLWPLSSTLNWKAHCHSSWLSFFATNCAAKSNAVLWMSMNIPGSGKPRCVNENVKDAFRVCDIGDLAQQGLLSDRQFLFPHMLWMLLWSINVIIELALVLEQWQSYKVV